MTRVVDGLVEAGLARREPHPDSARQVLVSATDGGTALMRAAAARRVDALVRALGTLPLEQRATLAAAAPLLDTVARRIPHDPR
jgi:DNA-binding MarR family transcriptional regulator